MYVCESTSGNIKTENNKINVNDEKEKRKGKIIENYKIEKTEAISG